MPDVEQRLYAVALELTGRLRVAEGLDAALADRLVTALEEAAKTWAGANTVPRSLAALFVGLAPGIESCSYLYSDERVAQDIREFSMRISDMVDHVLND